MNHLKIITKIKKKFKKYKKPKTNIELFKDYINKNLKYMKLEKKFGIISLKKKYNLLNYINTNELDNTFNNIEIKHVNKNNRIDKILESKQIEYTIKDDYLKQNKKFNLSYNQNKFFTFIKKNNLKKWNNKKWYIIIPDNTLIKIFDFILYIFIIYSITIVPFILAYYSNSTFFIIQIIDLISDIFFLIDIVRNFFLAYEDENNNLIIEHKKIIQKYIFTWFIIDLITSIPTSFFLNNYNGLKFIRLAKFPRLLKIIRIVKFAKIFKIFKKY